MQRRDFLFTSLMGAVALAAETKGLAQAGPALDDAAPANGRILLAGGRYDAKWVGLMARLTGKARPKILYLPTANGDNPTDIIRWFEMCAPLNIEPSVQKSFINSRDQQKSWEEVLLGVDGIVVSGGNTLNQQAIWKAQGIDLVLRKAWARGVILGGASAGSLCWFEEGSTDSRPKELSIVKGLGFIKGSHAPHYDAEPGRRPQYQRLIASGQMMPGFACDNSAGIYFEGAKPVRFLSTVPSAKVYSVAASGGKVVETVMPTELF